MSLLDGIRLFKRRRNLIRRNLIDFIYDEPTPEAVQLDEFLGERRARLEQSASAQRRMMAQQPPEQSADRLVSSLGDMQSTARHDRVITLVVAAAVAHVGHRPFKPNDIYQWIGSDPAFLAAMLGRPAEKHHGDLDQHIWHEAKKVKNPRIKRLDHHGGYAVASPLASRSSPESAAFMRDGSNPSA